MPQADDDAATYFRSLPRNMVQNTMKILDHEDAVHKLDPDHFDVISLRTPSRRVRVVRRDDLWRCRVDKENNQDQPCSHILAVLIYEGIVDLPNTAATVWTKGKQGRKHATEALAWRQVPTKLPELLARLLREGLPVVAPPAPPLKTGRPRKPPYALLYQAIMRVATRQSLYSSQGAMTSLDHASHNSYGACGIATVSRFLNEPDTTTVLEKFLALTTWPAKPYETLVHPDGTGLTEQRFSSYFDERYRRKKKKAKKTGDSEAKKEEEGPRLHNWTYAEMLWTYRYTMVAAIHAQQGPFGEAPWLIPLLERARIMLDIGELGGDKAYQAYYIFDYARRHGIDPQIKFKRNTNPTRSNLKKRAFKRTFEESRIDPEGYAAKANRRNNAETGNHAFKAILGDQIYSKTATAQRNEILCMCIAYNLTRLIYLGLDQGIEVGFAAGAQVLARAEWVPLEWLHAQFRGTSTPRPEWT
ncbi:MAG TPA: transposase [Candidatus Thermoplasmatota archaeon]|nr:transposase [Candidatus Thermoplasmatota archaeon]